MSLMSAFFMELFFKIVIFTSTSLKLKSLNRKLYVDIKNGLNLENPETLGAYKIVI